MSIPGPTAELIAWLACSAILGASALAAAWADWNKPREGWAWDFGATIALALFLFLSFKAGFVRHDLHSLIAWSALALSAVLLLSQLERNGNGYRPMAISGLVAAIATAALLGRSQGTFFPSPMLRPMEIWQGATAQLFEAVHLGKNPAGWLEEQHRRSDRAAERIRLVAPLHDISGSIDIIPSQQSEIVANRLDYRPRPTVQEYATYSPALIARNRTFFESERAPRHILMKPGSIDYRHPASAEGSLWPHFLSAYEPVATIRDMVQLTRRRNPLAELVGPESGGVARFREPIPLPPGDAPILLKARIERKLIGRLLDIAFKPPIVTMNATYPDGRVVPYRIIPGMISEGMVISPLVETTADYLMLAAGRMDAPSWRRPVSISFDSGLLGAAAYKREIAISFAPLSAAKLREATIGNAYVEAATRRMDLLQPLLTANPLKPPHLDLVAEGLLAHAPMSLRLAVTPGSRLRIAFGIRDGAWQGDAATDGVCFSVNTSTGAPLYQRCLQPKSVAGDRGVQEAEIQIPPDVNALSLETTCMANCAWDWSYWSAATKASE